MDARAFDFVTPKTFRTNIIESVGFVAYLWVLAQQIEEKYRDEMARTVILYNISIVEALLLFWAKKHKIKFLEDKYTEKYVLPKNLQGIPDKELLVAHCCKIEKPDARIWLHDLVSEGKQLLGSDLHSEIIDLQDIRNTFHLSKTRRTLSLDRAEDSFDVVLEVVNKIKKDITKA